MGTDDGPTDAANATQDAPVSTTRVVSGTDPNRPRRAVRRTLEEFAGDESDPSASQDGSKGRFTAVTDGEPVEAGAIPYRPYGPHSAMVVVIGFIFMIPTIFLSLLVSGVALYLYYRERAMDLPLERRDVVRVQVADRDEANVNGDDGPDVAGGEETNVGGDDGPDVGGDGGMAVTVTCTADTYLSVDADRVAELSWARRIATMNYVNFWHNLIADDPVERNVDDTVMGYLTAWADRDPTSHANTVRSLQEPLERDADRRREYTDLLSEQLPGVEDELERHRESVRADLEALADEIAVAVERSDA